MAAAAAGRCACRKSRDVQDAGTQTDTTLQGNNNNINKNGCAFFNVAQLSSGALWCVPGNS